MSVEFTDAVLAGVTLVREAIQSQNFVQGAEGWRIAADGKAEFSDLTIRSSDGSQSTVTVANGKITITDGAGVIRAELDADGYRAYTSSGSVAAAVKSDPNNDDVGFWTRNFIFPESTTAELTGGQLRFRPLTDGEAAGYADVGYAYQPAVSPDPAYVFLELGSGHVASGGTPALLRLWSTDGERPYAEFGDAYGNPTNVVVDGTVSATNIQSGLELTPDPPSGGGTTTVNVTFDTAFDTTPNVTLGINTSTDPETRVIRAYVDNVTTTGFTLKVYRNSGAGTYVDWIAIAT